MEEEPAIQGVLAGDAHEVRNHPTGPVYVIGVALDVSFREPDGARVHRQDHGVAVRTVIEAVRRARRERAESRQVLAARQVSAPTRNTSLGSMWRNQKLKRTTSRKFFFINGLIQIGLRGGVSVSVLHPGLIRYRPVQRRGFRTVSAKNPIDVHLALGGELPKACASPCHRANMLHYLHDEPFHLPRPADNARKHTEQ